MRRVIHFSFLLVTMMACSESNFNETSEAEAVDTQKSGEAVPEPPPPEPECIEGDRINLNFPPEIQSCVDQKKIFDFSTKTCIDVSQASFECGFDQMAASVAAIGVPNTSITKAKEDGALLISCSEKNEGKTIIAQWFYPGSKGTCDFTEALATRVVTACYKLYVEGEAPPASTPEERNAAVTACLNE